jgi:hypothetical protein
MLVTWYVIVIFKLHWYPFQSVTYWHVSNYLLILVRAAPLYLTVLPVSRTTYLWHSFLTKKSRLTPWHFSVRCVISPNVTKTLTLMRKLVLWVDTREENFPVPGNSGDLKCYAGTHLKMPSFRMNELYYFCFLFLFMWQSEPSTWCLLNLPALF